MTFSLGGESAVLRVGKTCPPMTLIQPVERRVGGATPGGAKYCGSIIVGMGGRLVPTMGGATLLFRGVKPTPDSCMRILF